MSRRRHHTRSALLATIGATGLALAVTVASAASAASAAVAPPAGDTSPATHGGLTLSATSGPVGSIVEISGNAGPGCVAGSNWFGFDFIPLFPASGPVDQMTPPIAADGSWTAAFQIPSWMSGAADRGPGAATTPGQYLITAPTSCTATPPPKAVSSFTVTVGAVPSATSDAFVGIAPTPDGGGYWLAQADGAVDAFGDARPLGSLATLGVHPASPIVGITPTADGRGYWLAGADGGVFAFGDARSFGSLPALGVTPEAPIVGIAATGDGHGYWLVGSDGGVFTFGDAPFAGTPGGDLGVVNAIGATTSGYALSGASFGGLFTFPGGDNAGSAAGTPLAASLTGAAFTPAPGDHGAPGSHGALGAWQVGLDGGVRALAGAPFEGSLPAAGITPAAPIVGIAATGDGRGYWLLGSDGGVFTFGDATFHGSPAGG